MQILDGQPVYSATDLVGFLACNHLTDLERCRQLGLVEKPHRSDPELEIIIKRGFEHEQAYIGRLREQGRKVTDVSAERPERLVMPKAVRRARVAGASSKNALSVGLAPGQPPSI